MAFGPPRIVSLFEMLEFYAPIFMLLMRRITEFEARYKQFLESREDQDHPLDEETKSQLSYFLKKIKEHCVSLDLDCGADKAQSILFDMCREFKASEMTTALSELQDRIEDQLKHRLLMFVPNRRARYYQQEDLFGLEVTNEFPGCIYDIEEAGKCIAVGRWTAVVFHLMRVMERGVRSLAVKLNAPFNEKATWGEILNSIDAEIKKMPRGTAAELEAKAPYEQASASLHAVKDAWRNPTMHPRAQYDEERAIEIFANVKTFMKRLVDIVYTRARGG